MSSSTAAVSLGLALAALVACGCDSATSARSWPSGSAGSVGVGGSASGGGEAGPTPAGFLPESAPGSTALRRLTRAEYRNLVRDVLGVEPPAEHLLPEDWTNAGFRSTADQLTTVAMAARYLDAALDVGERLLPTIGDLMPCSAANVEGELACIDDFLTDYGPRLFRRPMSEQERSRFAVAFEQTRASETYEESASLIVEALLVAPELLFIELPSLGEPGEALLLDDWQVATRLSLLLWDSVPDEALLTAAAHGELTAGPALSEHVARMLEDPRASAAVRSFFDDWLGLGKAGARVAETYPSLPSEIIADLAEEPRAHAEDVFLRRDFRELFVSGRRFRSTWLSNFYADQLGQDETVAPYEAEVTEQRFGLLSQSGFLLTLTQAEDSSPIHRGAFVRRKLLCGRLPSAPAGVAVPLPPLVAGATKRQTIEQHTGGAGCSGCHGMFNGFGFALEHFDARGSWRDHDRKLAIDARATFDEPGLRADVDGALQLSQALAESPSARACAVQQLFSFALERAPTSSDEAWFNELHRSFESSGFRLSGLLSELATSEAFRSRTLPGAAP